MENEKTNDSKKDGNLIIIIVDNVPDKLSKITKIEQSAFYWILQIRQQKK